MIITYHGESFVKVQHGDLAVVWNPIGKVGQMRIGGKDPFVINGPGEYEVSNVFVCGFGVPGPKETINSIYLLALDGLRLLHWGVMIEDKIPESVMSDVGEVDILFVPLTNLPSAFGEGGLVLSPTLAYRLALTFQPKIIIPLSESESVLRQFLKEADAEKVGPIDKLVLKKKDVLEK